MRQYPAGYNPRFDDWYGTPGQAWDESAYVFLHAQGLPERFSFRPETAIGETGFGLGINLWVLMQALGDFPQARVAFRSFEAFPPEKDLLERSLADYHVQLEAIGGIERALSFYEDLGPQSSGWGPKRSPASLPNLEVQVFWGDALEGIRTLSRQKLFDAWFLDGHDPKKNPELWSSELLEEIAARTAPAGTASSYTAAGRVKTALRASGFDLVRKKGFGSKRHMILCTRRP